MQVINCSLVESHYRSLIIVWIILFSKNYKKKTWTSHFNSMQCRSKVTNITFTNMLPLHRIEQLYCGLALTVFPIRPSSDVLCHFELKCKYSLAPSSPGKQNLAWWTVTINPNIIIFNQANFILPSFTIIMSFRFFQKCMYLRCVPKCRLRFSLVSVRS
jgi:hypothetical protein